jgi:hypothetical protein
VAASLIFKNMEKINPKQLSVATGKDPLRYPMVQGNIEKVSINAFKLTTNKNIVDITKKMVEILKSKH